MHSCRVAGLLCLLVFAEGRADEAVLRDGRKLPGRLTLDGTRWQFHPAGKGEPLAPGELQHVRLETGSFAALHDGLPLRVELRGEQWLTGGLSEVGGKNVLLKTAWAESLTVPRNAVSALRHPSGWGLVHRGDLGVILSATGQTTESPIGKNLAEGRAAVTFQESGDPAGARWLVEVDFLVEKQTRRLSILLAGEGKEYRVTSDGLSGESTPVPRSSGQHRLVVQFSATALRVLIDDAVLWHSLKKGPGGPLARWAMTCRPLQPARATEGQVSFSQFSLHRAWEDPRRPGGDPEQDEVWLAGGDQLFGRFLRADRQEIVIEGAFGRRALPWTSVRGVFPKPPERTMPARDRVRLWLDNGFDSQPDVLDGVMLSLDERRCRLRHADLGEISLERGRLLRVSWPGNHQR